MGRRKSPPSWISDEVAPAAPDPLSSPRFLLFDLVIWAIALALLVLLVAVN